jgi:hypothetical protein
MQKMALTIWLLTFPLPYLLVLFNRIAMDLKGRWEVRTASDRETQAFACNDQQDRCILP